MIKVECSETVKDRSNEMYSGFITYSNTINFASKWLDNSDYLITKWIFCKITGYEMVQKIGKKQKSDQGWEN